MVEILNCLLETPLTWGRDAVDAPRGEVPLNLDLGDTLDWEELPSSPQPCTERDNESQGTGWPFSPISPTPMGYPTAKATGETEEWDKREPEEGSESHGTQTHTPQGNRSGPDYVLRDYLRGNVVFLSPRIYWPYSPILPNTPGPRPSNYPGPKSSNPLGRELDKGWMDSQNSGKGKSPVGKKGNNKGMGGRARRDAQGTNQPSMGTVVQGSGHRRGPKSSGLTEQGRGLEEEGNYHPSPSNQHRDSTKTTEGGE